MKNVLEVDTQMCSQISAKILNKDKKFFNYKINSFNSLKGIFQEICLSNHLGTFQRKVFFSAVTWVSELKIELEIEPG